jgi:Zn-dependent peptidase ImmA (M78 family)
MGLSKQPRFPIMHLLEMIMPKIDEEFHIEILPYEKMGECFGVACPEEHKIILRQDVYNGACHNEGMHRFTVAHEIGHYLLHRQGTITLARLDPKEKIPAYRDPEWQANCFAAELLMPVNLIRNMSVDEVIQSCQVSFSAARVQQRNMYK